MRIVVVGVGYVGLVSGACLAEFGSQVTCIDSDAERIAALQRGCVPLFEPQLEELIARNVEAGRLAFATALRPAAQHADVVFIAVGTPSREDGQADLSAVHAACREVAGALRTGAVVVVKSTVPVGTGDEIERTLRQLRPDAACFVVSNPEFLREGCAVRDFMMPDRVVIGSDDARARQRLADLYAPLAARSVPILFTSRRAAELTKYAANAFLATKIAFINEIADLCEHAGADVSEVAHGLGLDSRIGDRFLQPGPGFGGSCFPKDTLALAKIAEDHGVTLSLVEAVITTNDARKRSLAQRIAAAMGGRVRGRSVAVLGLTFKADTDDMRHSPALDCIADLQAMGAQVRAYDPAGMLKAKRLLKHVRFARDAYDCAAGADAVAVMTEWEEFRALDLRQLKRLMAQPVIVDLRNIFEPEEAVRYGFRYSGVGRGEARALTGRKVTDASAAPVRRVPEAPPPLARPITA